MTSITNKFLSQIDFNITDLCNKTCSFCPRSSAAVYPNNNQNISLELFQKGIDQIDAEGFTGVVILAGRGESSNHPKYESILEILMHSKRKYRTQVTTNGYKIEKYWPTYQKLDQMVLNTYSTKTEYLHRLKTYLYLDNGKKPEAHFKPSVDMAPDQIDALPAHHDFNAGGKEKKWKYAFNTRQGMVKRADGRNHNPYHDKPCIHPWRGIFINFDGGWQFCCNDWKYQFTLSNIQDENMFETYRSNVQLNRARYHLLNGDRKNVLPCAECDQPLCPTKFKSRVETNEINIAAMEYAMAQEGSKEVK